MQDPIKKFKTRGYLRDLAMVDFDVPVIGATSISSMVYTWRTMHSATGADLIFVAEDEHAISHAGGIALNLYI